MEIIYTKEFSRLFKKLTKEIQAEAFKKEKIFKADPFDPRLKTHKPSGNLNDCWAFSISYSHRVVFEFGKNKIIYFLAIGGHDVYR